MSEGHHDSLPSLPSWWFEVDEVDDIDTNTSLLQELDIDLPQIYRYLSDMEDVSLPHPHPYITVLLLVLIILPLNVFAVFDHRCSYPFS